MLSMKTLKVAFAATVSALLLGPGLATAQDIQLDGKGTDAPKPLVYALETVSSASSTEVLKVKYYAVQQATGTDLNLQVKTKIRIFKNDNVFLRLELGGGALFHGQPEINETGTAGDNTQVVAAPYSARGAGGVGENFIYWKLVTEEPINIGSTIEVGLTGAIGVPATAGNYTAAITAHGNSPDANAGRNAIATFSGSATVYTVVEGLDVKVNPGTTATASVNAGFLRFIGGPPTGLTSQPKLGNFSVQAREIQNVDLLHAGTGVTVTAGDLVAEAGVSAEIEGDLSIGAFSLVEEEAAPANPAACPGATASPENPHRGTLTDGAKTPALLVSDKGVVSAATRGVQGDLDAGTYSLCVNIDVTGPKSNTQTIPAGTYTATISTKASPTADPVEAATGTIGRIARDGTSVRIAYLSADDSYNQRIIISNRSKAEAAFDISEFVAEDGTTIELTSAAAAAKAGGLNVIPAGGQVVLRVSDILEFTGRNRGGATVSVNSTPQNIQIATTQVNLEDGSTDTVVYDSTEGSGL